VAVSVSKTVTVPVSISETVSGSVCQRDCHKPRPQAVFDSLDMWRDKP